MMVNFTLTLMTDDILFKAFKETFLLTITVFILIKSYRMTLNEIWKLQKPQQRQYAM